MHWRILCPVYSKIHFVFAPVLNNMTKYFVFLSAMAQPSAHQAGCGIKKLSATFKSIAK